MTVPWRGDERGGRPDGSDGRSGGPAKERRLPVAKTGPFAGGLERTAPAKCGMLAGVRVRAGAAEPLCASRRARVRMPTSRGPSPRERRPSSSVARRRAGGSPLNGAPPWRERARGPSSLLLSRKRGKERPLFPLNRECAPPRTSRPRRTRSPARRAPSLPRPPVGRLPRPVESCRIRSCRHSSRGSYPSRGPALSNGWARLDRASRAGSPAAESSLAVSQRAGTPSRQGRVISSGRGRGHSGLVSGSSSDLSGAGEPSQGGRGISPRISLS